MAFYFHLVIHNIYKWFILKKLHFKKYVLYEHFYTVPLLEALPSPWEVGRGEFIPQLYKQRKLQIPLGNSIQQWKSGKFRQFRVKTFFILIYSAALQTTKITNPTGEFYSAIYCKSGKFRQFRVKTFFILIYSAALQTMKITIPTGEFYSAMKKWQIPSVFELKRFPYWFIPQLYKQRKLQIPLRNSIQKWKGGKFRQFLVTAFFILMVDIAG